MQKLCAIQISVSIIYWALISYVLSTAAYALEQLS